VIVTYSLLCNLDSVYEPVCTVSGSHSASNLGRTKTDARLGGCSSHFLRLAATKLISSPRTLTELCMTHSTYHTKRYKTGLTWPAIITQMS
jgi:hypothetical protein